MIDHDPDTLKKSLSVYGFNVGDLVVLHAHGLNSGGVIYRITKDCTPINAIWGEYRDYYRSGPRSNRQPRVSYTWCNVNKKGKASQPVPFTRLHGCVELTPIFSFFPYRKGKKIVAYKQIKSRLKKVDVVKLGVTFYEFQRFLQDEAKRMSSDDA